MKQFIAFSFILLATSIQSQSLKEKLQAQASGKVLASEELPKGLKLYDEKTFTDTAGVSGVYHSKYPVRFFYINTMNAAKAFLVSQLTIEYVPAVHGARLHVVNKEEEKQVRKKSIGLDHSKVYEMGTGASDGLLALAHQNGLYGFQTFSRTNFTQLSYDYPGFNDVMVIRSDVDPDLMFVGHFIKVSSNPEKWEIKTYADRNVLGGYFNLLSKDPEKLKNYDSTAIANECLRLSKQINSGEHEKLGAKIGMPSQVVDDDTREAAYFDIVKEAAEMDKPEAWGDRLSYVYITKDWVVEKSGSTPTHRWCYVNAASIGWGNEKGRTIQVRIKEDYNGGSYGNPYFGGFKDALVTVSEKTINEFKH